MVFYESSSGYYMVLPGCLDCGSAKKLWKCRADDGILEDVLSRSYIPPQGEAHQRVTSQT